MVVTPGTRDAGGPNSRQGHIEPASRKNGLALEEVVENQVFVGIDMSKVRLDAALRPG